MTKNLLIVCMLGSFLVGLIFEQSASADFIDFTSSGTFGDAVDDQESGTFETGIAGLSLTISSISSTSLGTPNADAGNTQFGVDSTGSGSGSDASTAFDSSLNEAITLSFNQAATINAVTFAINGSGAFNLGETFSFAGESIQGDGATSVFTFASPISLFANEDFSLSATSGRVGFVGMQVTAVPDPSSLTLAVMGGIGILARRRCRCASIVKES
ncbi:MAG: PEP-CTERM sorting domain-containing protein [Planctomycetota bacterium]